MIKKDIAILTILLLLVIGAMFIRSQSEKGSLTSDSGMKLSDVEIEQQDKDSGKGGDNTMTDTAKAPAMEIDEKAQYSAVLKTSMGSMTVKLYAQDTPMTVNNFVVLAEKGFYNGTIFHRIIEDFMIQGGDPDGVGTGGPGYRFADEITPMEFDGPGILAMANSGPDTNGSQFFITHAPTPWLNGKHTIFGKVTEGMDVLNAIATVDVGPNDKPLKDVILETVTISKN